MGFPPREVLEIVEIVYYVPALIATVLIMIRHGFQRRFGWIYLAILALLRLIGSSTGIAWQHDQTNDNLLAAYIICFTIGLSPLLLCLIGTMGRVHSNMSQRPVPETVMRLLRLPIIAALVLAILGGTDQFSSNSNTASQGRTFMKAAILVFLAILITAAGIAILTMLQIERAIPSERKLVVAGVCVVPFLFVRIIYSLVAAFDYKSPNFEITSTKDEAVILQAFLSVLMEFIAVAIFIVAGLVTPPTPRDSSPESHQMPGQTFGKPAREYTQQQGVV